MPLSPRPWLPLVLAGIGIVLAAGWFTSNRDHARQLQAITNAQHQIDKPEQRQLQPRVSTATAGTPDTFTDASTDSEAIQGGIRQLGQERQQQWQAVESGFKRESRNPQWSAPLEASLLEATLDSSLNQVARPQHILTDCRSRTCKVSAQFANRSQAADWAQVYIVSSGRQLTHSLMQIIPNDDGTVEVRIYGRP